MAQPIQLVADSLASILGECLGMTRERAEISWIFKPEQPGSGRGKAPDALWLLETFRTGDIVDLYVGAPLDVWSKVGAWVLSGIPGQADDIESVRTAYIDLIRQALAGVAHTLTKDGERGISYLKGEELESAPETFPLTLQFTIRFSDATVSPLWIGCPSAFLSAIHDLLQAPPPVAQAAPAARSEVDDEVGQKLGLLIEVELPVSVSFGKTSLPLKDILKLGIGSIVELNRLLAEPVEVVVNNCVIARGEVVVVEGNYGVRVVEVAGKRERLNSLR